MSSHEVREACCDCGAYHRGREVRPHVAPCIYAPEDVREEPAPEEGAPYEVRNFGDREEWLSLRLQGIGASDSPAILGASSWASPVSVYSEKIGNAPTFKGSEKTDMGSRMEPVIIRLLEEDLNADDGTGMWSSGSDGRLLRSTRYPFMQASLDGELVNGETGASYIIEAKNSESYSAWDDGPPRNYWIQCQHQMVVTDTTRMILVVLIRGWMLRWAWVDRDEDFCDTVLIPECRTFWDCVERRELPAVDGNPATAKALAVLFPDAEKGSAIPLPGTFIERDREYMEIRRRIGELTEQADAIKNEIRAEIGDAEGGKIPGDGALWRWSGKGSRRSLRRYGEDG